MLTTRPYRQHGQLIDLPGAALHAATAAGLQPAGRYVALLAGIRGGRLVSRASFFQMANTRAARTAGIPLQIPAHEDILVLRAPAAAGQAIGSRVRLVPSGGWAGSGQ